MTAAKLPLAAVRVVEISTTRATAIAGRLLAQLGAEVLLCPASRQTGADLPFGGLMQGKRQIGNEAAPAFCRGLVVLSDQSFSNLQIEAAYQIGTVLCHIDAPRDQPEAGNWNALLDQALSGVMMTGGQVGDPPVPIGFPLAEGITAANAVNGILAALWQAERDGAGELVEISQLSSLSSLMAVEDYRALELMDFPYRTGNTLKRASPFGTYRGRDGYLSIAAGGRDHFAHKLFRAMGREDLITDPRTATVTARSLIDDEMTDLIETWLDTMPVDRAEVLLLAHDVPCAVVKTVSEALEEPVLRERGEIEPLAGHSGHWTMGLPIRFINTA